MKKSNEKSCDNKSCKKKVKNHYKLCAKCNVEQMKKDK